MAALHKKKKNKDDENITYKVKTKEEDMALYHDIASD